MPIKLCYYLVGLMELAIRYNQNLQNFTIRQKIFPNSIRHFHPFFLTQKPKLQVRFLPITDIADEN